MGDTSWALFLCQSCWLVVYILETEAARKEEVPDNICISMGTGTRDLAALGRATLVLSTPFAKTTLLTQ